MVDLTRTWTTYLPQDAAERSPARSHARRKCDGWQNGWGRVESAL